MKQLHPNDALENAQEMKNILKNIMQQGEKLCELSAAFPCLQNVVFRRAKDISEPAIDLIYMLSDYIGVSNDSK